MVGQLQEIVELKNLCSWNFDVAGNKIDFYLWSLTGSSIIGIPKQQAYAKTLYNNYILLIDS